MKLDDELDSLYQDYFKDVQKVALREFEKKVKPYLQSIKAEFYHENGTWWIVFNGECYSPNDVSSDRDVKRIMFKSKPGREVYQILQATVFRNETLALYMPAEE